MCSLIKRNHFIDNIAVTMLLLARVLVSILSKVVQDDNFTQEEYVANLVPSLTMLFIMTTFLILTSYKLRLLEEHWLH